MPARDSSRTRQNARVCLSIAARTSVCFQRGASRIRQRVEARTARDAAGREKALRRSSTAFHADSRRRAEDGQCDGHHLCRTHMEGRCEDDTAEAHNDSRRRSRIRVRGQRQRLAQTQATTTNATQTSGDQDQSAAAMAQAGELIRSPVVGCCSYSRTTIGRRCPAATIRLGCRAICCSSRC